MRKEATLWKYCVEVYNLMYSESTPSANFDKLWESGKTNEPDWFMKYYLPIERQVEIIDSILKKHRCSKIERNLISSTIHLGCSPNSSEKTWHDHTN